MQLEMDRMTRRVPLFYILLLLSFSLPAKANDELILGIFPRHSYNETLQMFSPLVKYLSEQLGKKVKLETASNFEAFWRNVQVSRYDIVHYNQYHYLESNKKYGYQLILKNEEFGSADISSVIMVRKDRGIDTLDNLAGKKIIFGGDEKAMMSYLVPRKLLLNAGLAPSSYDTEFARNPPNALMAVYMGRADAAGVGDVIPRLNSMAHGINLDEMKTIAQSDAFPHLAWAVKQGFDKKTSEELVKILIGLSESEAGKKILESAKMTGFHPATHDEYVRLYQFLK